MKYVFIWIAYMSIANLVTLGIAAFIMWDVSYFLLGNWTPPARIVYLVFVGLIAFVAYFCCREEYSKQDK